MIIVKLQGGLGNQMFQYAVGKALSDKWNVPLLLDTTLYKNNTAFNITPREFELKQFNIKAEIATLEDIQKAKGEESFRAPITAKVYRKIFKYLGYSSFVFDELTYNYDSKIKKKIPPIYLNGYWQSEKYFKNIATTIRHDFTLKNALDAINTDLKTDLESSNSVSIHIRRGDYFKNTSINKVHGLCSIEYYQRAMKLIEEQNNSINYNIFSDDIGWAKENIASNYPIHFFTHNNGVRNYIDLVLMSSCKHNIIANSSFSWWGAWLNTNPKKIVIAPKKWFQSIHINMQDRLPSQWIRL